MNIDVSAQRDCRVLSRIYSRNVINELATKGDSRTLELVLNQLGLDSSYLAINSLFSFYDASFEKLKKYYRNEYVFKNAIASKIVKGKHKLSNCYFSSEFNVGKSIADVAVFNGTSTVYEIKTDYDSYDRLKVQLDSYLKVFDKVNIVVPNSKIPRVFDFIPDSVGVIGLSSRYTLSKEREATSNIENISYKDVFYCLRKEEYLAILNDKFGYVSDKRPKEAKNEAFSLFKEMDINSVHVSFVEAMKKRELKISEREMIYKMPESLISVLLSLRLSKNKLDRLYNVLID